jgi:hypothetical protein
VARRPARGGERSGTPPWPLDQTKIDGQGASSSSPSHARDELDPELGFRGADAYQGRLAQVRAGIGRGEVGEDNGGCRTRMQGLEVHKFSPGDRTSTARASSVLLSPARDQERVRSR